MHHFSAKHASGSHGSFHLRLNNLDSDEKTSLEQFLFASSCRYAKDGSDKLFKQSSYPDQKIVHYENVVKFLKTRVGEYGSNSNLTEADNLYASYRRMMARKT